MVDSNTSDKPISEVHIKALYSRLQGVLEENLYAPAFSKQLQVWRETLHPRGKADIRRLDGFDGLTVQVNLGDRLGCDIYYGFIQESWDYSLFMAILKPGDIVIDIGSNFGMYALGAAKRLVSNGRVFAFEPDVRSMSLLKENIRLNKFEHLVTCQDVCIGSYDGTVDFYAAADPSFSGIYDTNRSETTGRLTLPIRQIDTVMREQGISQVNKIKIDVEGAEYEVLEGAAEILASSDAIIMLEISSKNLDKDRTEKLSVTLGKLENQGYVAFQIDHEVTPAKLIFDKFLMNIVRKTSDGQTRNYFLVKRSGEQFNFIQDVFNKLLNQDSLPLQENIYYSKPYSHLIKNTDGEKQPLLLHAEIGELDNLHAMLWAERIEKHIALDFNRKLLTQNHVLESKLVEVSKELAAQVEDAAIKTKLVEISKELEEQVEEATAIEAKFIEISKELVVQEREKVAFKAKLAETNKKLVAQEEEKAVFKAKLTETSKKLTETSKKLTETQNELSTLNSGFLGFLFRIKRRLLNRGILHV
ncbi:FkbM family methyltransferase [Methylobacter sp.]|uniref:FkbM family methyltransferase n=1 Tax=Methylobacter sp. TaxID=2051955 RepID=UPI0011F48568|nr:FkbM family methyltransferase [Methylobacter sp.]TAK64236.1 MAG: FkbM family methyltransferase [Methylobacter sp.]